MIRSIRKHLSFANIMASFAVFIALGGSAYAVGKNTIGTSQIKNNAVTAKKIKKNAVTAAKIKNGSISTAKIAKGAVSGDKVNTATLAQVPSAASAVNADVAGSVVGQENFFVKLNGGQTQKIASHGQVSLLAECVENDNGSDRISIYAETTADGAILAGDDDKSGGPNPSNFLNIDTPLTDRVFEAQSDDTNQTYVNSEIDSGFVLGPDGKAIVANTEGMILGLNYLGSRCIAGGVLNFIDAPQ